MRRFILALGAAALLMTPTASAFAQTQDCSRIGQWLGAIRVGATCTAELTSEMSAEGGQTWLFPARANECLEINMRSSEINSYLEVGAASRTYATQFRDDNSGGGLDARLRVRPAETSTYRIVATTSPGIRPQVGRYTLSVERVSC